VRGKPRSVRQAQALLSTRLRQQGHSWAEIGAIFQAQYRVNPRVALRQAHGWSQPQAAKRWTENWPEDPKTFKNFSYWEQWPGQTGHAPSLDTLDRLSQLYECRITDLLTDCQDYGTSPQAAAEPSAPARRLFGDRGQGRANDPDESTVLTLPPLAGPGPARDSAISASALRTALEMIRRAGIDDPAQPGGTADDPGARLRRRTLLLEASSALAVVAAAPVLEVPRIVAGPRAGRISSDLAIVNYTGEVVAGLRRFGGAVGPRITLPPAMALRAAMAALARNVPEIVTSQAVTAYADLTQLIGWMMFNLGDHKAARYYYDDARAAAYRAGNDDLASFALAAAAQLAIARHRPRLALDHAHAAQHVAKASGNAYATAYAADITARAYASAGQVGRCEAALDKEQDALCSIGDDTERAPWWYFYDRSFYWGTESECALLLGRPVDAEDAASRSLQLLAPLNLHNNAFTLAFRAEALIRQREFDEACEMLAASARVTTLNSSRRITRRIDVLRRQLRGAGDTAAVRDLDEKLAEYRRARVAAEPLGLAAAAV
jgi:hypothetical protein